MSAADNNQAVYRERLQTLQKIRARADGKLKLAQICVLGDQSSGKSSLLAACTGIAFPEHAGICTRAPIVVECKCDMNMTDDEYRIQGPTGVYELCKDLEELKTRITNAQDRALKKLQEHAASPRQWADVLDESAEEDDEMLADTGKSAPTPVSMDEIRVKVRGSRQMDIIVVDLPGIIHNGAGADETRELIRRYCEPRQTLMLLVSEAKQDEESIEAICLAKKYDQNGSRTLRVLTKFDVFDTDKAHERACSWVAAGGSTALGCHAVVCRSRGADHDTEVEAGHLEGLPAGHSGVSALKARLPPLFADLINHSLPDLHKQIVQTLQEAEDGLRMVGSETVSKTIMVYNFQKVVDDTKTFQKELAPFVLEFQKAIEETGGWVTKEWTDQKFKANPFTLPHFQGDEVVIECMHDIVDLWWRKPLEEFHDQVRSVTVNSMSLKAAPWKRDAVASLSSGFLRAVEAEWHRYCTELSIAFSTELHVALDKEREFGTMNSELESKFENQALLPDDLISKIAAELPGLIRQYRDYEQGSQVSKYLQRQRDAWNLSLQDHQQRRIFNAVTALWEVESKTFVDIVLKLTRDLVVQRRERWLSHDLPNNRKVMEMAVEDNDMAVKRDKLKEQISSMNDCLQELQGLRFCRTAGP